MVKNAKFLAQVGTLIRTIGVDKIRSYLRFQTVYSYAPFLDLRFEDVLLKWNKNLYGITVLPPRRKKCFFSTTGAMDMAGARVTSSGLDCMRTEHKHTPAHACVCTCAARGPHRWAQGPGSGEGEEKQKRTSALGSW